MNPFSAFSSVIDSVLASKPPDAGSPEAAMAKVVDGGQAGAKPPLLGPDQQAFVQTHVLPVLHILITKAEMERLVGSGADAGVALKYYAQDKVGEKQVGVEVLASRYYRNNDFPDMPIRTYGSTGGPYFHCAELVWNSAILAGFHVPMNKDARQANNYGFYNSANVLYDQCDRPRGVYELATPKPEDSFKATTVFLDASKKSIGLPGPRVGDLILASRVVNDAGVQAPGHIALLSNLGTTPPTFIEAGVIVGTDKYELKTKGINNQHDARLIRLRNPDWPRIERWLAEGAKPDDFAQYFKAQYPAGVKEKSYRGLFGLAVAQVGLTLPTGSPDAGQPAQTQLKRLQELLGLEH